MERLFQITAVILIGIAAYFLWQGNKDAAFVTGIFAAVCYFLSLRFQINQRIKNREEAEVEDIEESEKSEGAEDDN